MQTTTLLQHAGQSDAGGDGQPHLGTQVVYNILSESEVLSKIFPSRTTTITDPHLERYIYGWFF